MKAVTPLDRGFIEGPKDQYGDTKIVNLDQVSNIGFDEGYDRFGQPKYKVIYNFAYPISLKKNIIKSVPDYVYHVYTDKESYQNQIDTLNKQINQAKWFAPIIHNKISRIVNPKYISFISTDQSKNRIITNLACSISFYNNYERKTSDFIFFDFDTLEEMNEELLYLKDLLGL